MKINIFIFMYYDFIYKLIIIIISIITLISIKLLYNELF